MITYASRKRTFATFDEEEEQDARSLPTPPASSPKALQASSGNTTQSSTTVTNEKIDLLAADTLPITRAQSSHEDQDGPPSSPPISSALKPRKLPLLRTSHSAPARSSSQPQAKRQKLTQMTIDLGGPPQIRCKQCGMEYIPSNTEDRKLHATYHAASIGGVDVPFSLRANDSWPVVERIDGANGKRDLIVEVGRHSKLAARRFAKKVLEVVERELGAVETTENRLWDIATTPIPKFYWNGKTKRTMDLIVDRFKVYLYVRGSKCVGLLLAQRIPRAQRQECFGAASAPARAPEAPRARTPDAKDSPAVMGVSRIWVSKESQRCGIAIEMLDAARKEFTGTEIAREQIAFSQPTEMGLRLITRYITGQTGSCVNGVEASISEEEQPGWLMYDERDAETL